MVFCFNFKDCGDKDNAQSMAQSVFRCFKQSRNLVECTTVYQSYLLHKEYSYETYCLNVQVPLNCDQDVKTETCS